MNRKARKRRNTSDRTGIQEDNRFALLVQVSELARTHSDPMELLFQVSSALGNHLQVNRCLFNEIDSDKDVEIVHLDYSNGVPSVAGVHKISEYSSQTLSEIKSGKTIVNCDSRLDPRTAAVFAKTYGPNQEHAYIAVPLLRKNRWVATLWVSANKPREWTKQEVALVEEIARHTWALVERLRVDAALRESEERFQTLANGSPVLIWVNGLEGCEFVNRAYLDFLGVQAESNVRGYDWSVYVHPEDKEEYVRSYLNAFSQKASFSAEFRFRKYTGEYRWMRSEATPRKSPDGIFLGYVGASVDITERKRMEESLLESERRLKAALATAEEASRLKDEFLATVSHELRTPLNAILGWAHMLQSRAIEPAMTESAIETILRSAKNQAQIVDDLLNIAQITSGNLNLKLEMVSISETLSQALDTVSHALNSKNIQLVVQFAEGSEKTSIYADPQRILQVFWNLLSNAVKFTPVGGKIEISIEQSSTEIILTFQDTGIGIKPEFLLLIFDRFRQADSSSTRKYSGLGLGLSITKNLVELHGGTISAKSDGEGTGSIFTVRFPLGNLSKDLNVQDSRTRFDSTSSYREKLIGKRVLLVDDDQESLRLMREIFLNSSAEIRISTSATDAIETLIDWQPHLLISDIAMPDYDGYWLVQQLRSLPGPVNETPAIALTAYAPTVDPSSLLNAGFQVFVSKPVDPTHLIDVAAVVLGTEVKLLPLQVESSHLQGKRILLIEDDLISTEVIRIALERLGVDFRSASKASEALDTLKEWLPDAIVSDLGLPDEDGIKLIKRIRSLPFMIGRCVPAIALTGYGQDEGRRAVEAGFQIYKSKPIDPHTLIALLDKLIQQQKENNRERTT